MAAYVGQCIQSLQWMALQREADYELADRGSTATSSVWRSDRVDREVQTALTVGCILKKEERRVDVGRGRCAAEVYSVKCCCGWPAGAKEYRPIGIVINIKALRAASGWSGAVAAWRLDVWTAVDPKLNIFCYCLYAACFLSTPLQSFICCSFFY